MYYRFCYSHRHLRVFDDKVILFTGLVMQCIDCQLYLEG